MALFAATLLVGCDAAPGPVPLGNRPPEVSGLSYAPAVVEVNTGNDSFPVSEGIVSVPLVVESTALDPDGEVMDVAFVLQAPGSARSVVASAPMNPAGEGRFAASTTVALPVAEPGLYSLVVYAVDDQGRLSNQVRGSIRLINAEPTQVAAGFHMRVGGGQR